MPKVAKALTAIEVKRISTAGFHSVGTVSGLGLLVSSSDSKSWVLRLSYGGDRRNLGLGSYPETSLAEAINRARELKNQVARGVDPVLEKKRLKSLLADARAKAKTFQECAEAYLKTRTFRNLKHSKQWTSTLKEYVYPHMANILVKDITVAHIKNVLDPIWRVKTETATRIQGRMKVVIDYAIVSGYRETANPAVWKGYLDKIYQNPQDIKEVKHFSSLPYSEVFKFVSSLKKHEGSAARALEFLLLTAVRSESVRSASWKQFDFKNMVWDIPKEFTKTKKRNHAVPLTKEAISILKQLPVYEGCDLVFPSPQLKKLSDSSISKLMRDMKAKGEFLGEAVPHGFRSTFQVWRLEKTTYSQELGELCLMHEVGDAVYKAYQRSDGLEKRRAIMKDWSEFIYKPYPKQRGSNVVSLKTA